MWFQNRRTKFKRQRNEDKTDLSKEERSDSVSSNKEKTYSNSVDDEALTDDELEDEIHDDVIDDDHDLQYHQYHQANNNNRLGGSYQSLEQIVATTSLS